VSTIRCCDRGARPVEALRATGRGRTPRRRTDVEHVGERAQNCSTGSRCSRHRRASWSPVARKQPGELRSMGVLTDAADGRASDVGGLRANREALWFATEVFVSSSLSLDDLLIGGAAPRAPSRRRRARATDRRRHAERARYVGCRSARGARSMGGNVGGQRRDAESFLACRRA